MKDYQIMKQSEYNLWHLVCGIWKIISPLKKLFFLLLFCIIIELAYTIVLPLGLQVIIDKGIKNNDMNLIIHVIGGLGITYIIFTIAYLFDSYVLSILTARSLDYLRSRMMNQVYFLPVNYYQHHNSTKILARFSNDISTIENIFYQSII
jgi:ATP-binding cassette subfamily B protein